MEQLEHDVRTVGCTGDIALSGVIGSTFRGLERETTFRIDVVMLTHCVDALERCLLENQSYEVDPVDDVMDSVIRAQTRFLVSPKGMLLAFCATCLLAIWMMR